MVRGAAPPRRRGRAWPGRLALGLSLLLGLAVALPGVAKGPPEAPAGPAYSRLYDQALARAQAGDWQGALRGLSRVYAEEVPVQAFYDTLDRQKAALLAGLGPEALFRAGKTAFPLAQLRDHYLSVLLPQPDPLYQDLDLAADLPLPRLLHLYAVLGREPPRPPAGCLTTPATPRVDLAAALASPDPWLVAAALFLARKGQGRLTPAAMLDRWQARPDLWDEVCTAQARLFLAGQQALAVRELARQNPEAAPLWDGLRPWSAGEPPGVRVLLGRPAAGEPGPRGILRPAAGLALRFRPADAPGAPDAPDAPGAPGPPRAEAGGLWPLPPGRWVITYAQGRERGQSRPVYLGPTRGVRVVLVVRGEV
ncbi:MAG: hypothetical protein KQJ78_15720 [Deltaproteobacteria bacterium]|nr:hypothetical protein [Deltaproteobacteria bacterium]